MNFEHLVSPQQLAEKLNMAVATVHKLSNSGELPSYKIGRKIYFDLEEVKLQMKKNAMRKVKGDDHHE